MIVTKDHQKFYIYNVHVSCNILSFKRPKTLI